MRALRLTSLTFLACAVITLGCSTETASRARRDGGDDPLPDDTDGGGDLPGHDASRGPAPGCGPERYDAAACGDPELRAILGRLDSDTDGLTDEEELCVYFTDPCAADSDGDGISDLAEIAAGTDPLDAASRIDTERDFFVVLPYLGERAERPLRFGTHIQQADVFFLVDMTGSMSGVRRNIIESLVGTIIPGIAGAITNVQLGAGGYDDYPVSPYGGGNDLPFYLLREIAPADEDRGAWSIAGASATTCPRNASVRDIGTITGAPNGRSDILEAVEGLPCHGGADTPESTGPALWSTATGMGLGWPGGSIPGRTCPAIPDEPAPRRGYPCFRSGSLPIILVFGDADWHNGPGGTSAYTFAAPQYTEVVAALGGIGARVISIVNSSGSPRGYADIARDTGAVRADGSPLLFSIPSGGAGLGTAVVEAVRQLVGGTPQDVSTTTENVAGNPDDFDARAFIKAIRPVEGYGADGVPGPRPGISYASRDETTFYAVIPGTIVEFEVDFWNDVRPATDRAQVFQARIVVLGNGVARLDERRVFIVVPPEGGTILI